MNDGSKYLPAHMYDGALSLKSVPLTDLLYNVCFGSRSMLYLLTWRLIHISLFVFLSRELSTGKDVSDLHAYNFTVSLSLALKSDEMLLAAVLSFPYSVTCKSIARARISSLLVFL